MKALLVMALTLVVSTIAISFLPLPFVALQVLMVIVGSNAVLAIVFLLMAVSME